MRVGRLTLLPDCVASALPDDDTCYEVKAGKWGRVKVDFATYDVRVNLSFWALLKAKVLICTFEKFVGCEASIFVMVFRRLPAVLEFLNFIHFLYFVLSSILSINVFLNKVRYSDWVLIFFSHKLVPEVD